MMPKMSASASRRRVIASRLPRRVEITRSTAGAPAGGSERSELPRAGAGGAPRPGFDCRTALSRGFNGFPDLGPRALIGERALGGLDQLQDVRGDPLVFRV